MQKKRRFYGNRFTNANKSVVSTPAAREHINDVELGNNISTASAAKIIPVITECITGNINENDNDNSKNISDNKYNKDNITGYRFMDMEILSDIIKTLCCPECRNQRLELKENFSNKQGLASCLVVVCACGYTHPYHTSRSCGKKGFDINRRIVYTMRSCGLGYSGIERFTSFMNMPRPMTRNNFDKITNLCKVASKKVAEKSMQDAAKEIRIKKGDENAVTDTGITNDGAWQRRGHSSLNGFVATISVETGKILDGEVMSRKCKSCEQYKKIESTHPIVYESWKASHKCSCNYQGSAPNMEPTGTLKIFERSIEKNKLRYTDFYGDGDSKSHQIIENVYSGIKVQKLECIGHVQKRVGNRIRKLKERVKGLGGKGKLTNVIIDRLQNYYGIAIRSNVGDLKGMQKATLASLFHVASSKENNFHSAYCPERSESWCGAMRDKANTTNKYKHGPGIPTNIVVKHLKPIYQDLTSDTLLKKCLHGKTQNQNESFNGMVWERVPKTRYVALEKLEFGFYDAVANFNYGRKATLDILCELKLEPGNYTVNHCDQLNKARIANANYKATDSARKNRKIIRGKKKSNEDKNKQKEGVSYEPGGFTTTK